MRLGTKYFWTRAEEARLVELWRTGIRDFKVLGEELGRTPHAIKLKLTRAWSCGGGTENFLHHNCGNESGVVDA